jgi:hypothetical protein
VGIKHAWQSAASDGSDATKLQPSKWNADHVGGFDNPMTTGGDLIYANPAGTATDLIDAGPYSGNSSAYIGSRLTGLVGSRTYVITFEAGSNHTMTWSVDSFATGGSTPLSGSSTQATDNGYGWSGTLTITFTIPSGATEIQIKTIGGWDWHIRNINVFHAALVADRLPIGSTGDILKVSGGIPVWKRTLDIPPVLQFKTTYNAGTTSQVLSYDSAPTRALLALVQASGRGASSITQTNVTWTKRYETNSSGVYLEIWTGARSGTAGTDVTFNFASSTQINISCWEIDQNELTSVGTPATGSYNISSTEATAVLYGIPAGTLCLAAVASYNANTGYMFSNLPFAASGMGGCLGMGLCYYQPMSVMFVFRQSASFSGPCVIAPIT